MKNYELQPLSDEELNEVKMLILNLLYKMRIPTLDMITILYNILNVKFKICSICADKEELLGVAQELHIKLCEEIKGFHGEMD